MFRNVRINYKRIIAIVCISLVVPVLSLFVVVRGVRIHNSHTVVTEGVVVGKTARDFVVSDYVVGIKERIPNNKIILSFVIGQDYFEESIVILQEPNYNAIDLGDVILCEVIYDEAGVIDVDIIDTTKSGVAKWFDSLI